MDNAVLNEERDFEFECEDKAENLAKELQMSLDKRAHATGLPMKIMRKLKSDKMQQRWSGINRG